MKYVVTNLDGDVKVIDADYVTFDPTLIRFDNRSHADKSGRSFVAAFSANAVASVVKSGATK